MKKILKTVAVIFLVCAMLFAVTGCNYIDEMRANQGFWQKDGSILFRGSEYILLPVSEQLDPEWDDTYVYITEPNVPVLLSDKFGDWVDVSENGYFISTLITPDATLPTIYCRKDKYDEIKGYIENGIATNVYCYSYSIWNEDDWEYEYKKYTLTDAEKAAINKVIKEVKPEANSGSVYWDADYSVTIEARSADMNFCSETYDIAVYDDKFFLVTDNDKEDLNVYTVPKDLIKTFKNIVAEYDKSEMV